MCIQAPVSILSYISFNGTPTVKRQNSHYIVIVGNIILAFQPITDSKVYFGSNHRNT